MNAVGIIAAVVTVFASTIVNRFLQYKSPMLEQEVSGPSPLGLLLMTGTLFLLYNRWRCTKSDSESSKRIDCINPHSKILGHKKRFPHLCCDCKQKRRFRRSQSKVREDLLRYDAGFDDSGNRHHHHHQQSSDYDEDDDRSSYSEDTQENKKYSQRPSSEQSRSGRHYIKRKSSKRKPGKFAVNPQTVKKGDLKEVELEALLRMIDAKPETKKKKSKNNAANTRVNRRLLSAKSKFCTSKL